MVTSGPAWFERNPHLAGGVRVIGAVAAIVGALLVAKTEYHSAQRLQDGRVNAQITLIGNTASQFNPLVQQYIRLALKKDAGVRNYYYGLADDTRMEKMTDLKAMPVSLWPSNEIRHSFNEYLFSAIMLMETSEDEGASIELQDRVSAYAKKFEALNKTLAASRR
jgi:hypothetical protein